jgi:D-3-phosphoglycerate dehydrogenase / 2-oxoglutarate reductase
MPERERPTQASPFALCLRLIDAAALEAVKPGAALIDVSRGGIVHQAALIDALRVGRLAGAALDVFEIEPLPQGNPFGRWTMSSSPPTVRASMTAGSGVPSRCSATMLTGGAKG